MRLPVAGVQAVCRVETWRGGLGEPCLLPALSVAGARVSHHAPFPSRSSNQTGGFPASGSRRRLTRLACNAVCSFWTLSGVVRLTPISSSCATSCVPFQLRPFPPPALPGFVGTTGLSATPHGPACPSRAAGWCSQPPPNGASRVAPGLLAGMPSPIPRQDRIGHAIALLVVPAAHPIAAFPVTLAGRLLR